MKCFFSLVFVLVIGIASSFPSTPFNLTDGANDARFETTNTFLAWGSPLKIAYSKDKADGKTKITLSVPKYESNVQLSDSQPFPAETFVKRQKGTHVKVTNSSDHTSEFDNSAKRIFDYLETFVPNSIERKQETEQKMNSVHQHLPKFKGSAEPQEGQEDETRAFKRQARQAPSLNREDSVTERIVFPPEEMNRYANSMVNNKNLRPVDISSMASTSPNSRSRSYVYKNMDGRGYIYGITHNAQDLGVPVPSGSEVDYNGIVRNDAENVGPVQPPDLSRDLRVNPNGRSDNQGASMIDPDSEVFDLSLVIKEMESRANDI